MVRLGGDDDHILPVPDISESMGRLYDRLQFASDKVARAFFQLTIIIDIPSKVGFLSLAPGVMRIDILMI